MSKYELAVVVNAQIDDEARTAVVDRCKNLITRFGGEIGEIEDWGKKKLAYEIQKMNEAYYYFIPDREPYAHYGQCHQISVC